MTAHAAACGRLRADVDAAGTGRGGGFVECVRSVGGRGTRVGSGDSTEGPSSLPTPFELTPPHPPRFSGTAPEPRPGLSSGHIPHSLSLPFSTLLSPPSATDPAYQTLKPARELEATFVAALGGEDEWGKVKRGERSVVASCGSGMSAGVVWLALQAAGREESVGLYDEVSLSGRLGKGGRAAGLRCVAADFFFSSFVRWQSWTGYAAREESQIVKD